MHQCILKLSLLEYQSYCLKEGLLLVNQAYRFYESNINL